MALFPCGDQGGLHRVHLEEAFKALIVAPAAIKIIELDVAGFQIHNNRVQPIIQMDSKAGNRQVV